MSKITRKERDADAQWFKFFKMYTTKQSREWKALVDELLRQRARLWKEVARLRRAKS